MVEFTGFSAGCARWDPESIPELMRTFLSWNTRKAVVGERSMIRADTEPASNLLTLPAQFFHQVLTSTELLLIRVRLGGALYGYRDDGRLQGHL